MPAASIIQFIKTDIWRIRLKKMPKGKSFLIRQLRIILLAVRGFGEDKCLLRASALTFFSLLSIVPTVAMAFGIAKGFGFENMLEQKLLTNFPGQEEVITQVIGFARNMLENTKGGLIAGVGIGVLFWSVIKVLGQIEDAFNNIWGIKKSRTLARKFSDYMSVMLICPILMIMAGSVTVLISSQVTLIVSKLSFLGPLADVILFSLKILPYMVMWVVFSFIYIFMPNTKVNFKSGLMAGIFGGTIYQLWQWIYITFQVGVSSQGAIYGSFAALPLFLVWLQVSWFVVLFGAEISFAEQNVETYELEPDCKTVSRAFKRKIALLITQICVARFRDGEKPTAASEIGHVLELPIRLVRDVIFDLTESGVLSEVKVEEDEKANYYQPAIDIDKLTIQSVLDMMDNHGADFIESPSDDKFTKISSSLDEFSTLIDKSNKNLLLKDI